MGKWSVPLAFLAGVVVTITAIPIIRWVDGYNPYCVHEIVREFSSPNSQLKAIVTLSSCMLAPDATGVVIKRAGDSLNFNHHDGYLFIVKDKNNIEVEWNCSKTGIINTPGITITYDRPRQIYRQVIVDGMEPIAYIERQKNN